MKRRHARSRAAAAVCSAVMALLSCGDAVAKDKEAPAPKPLGFGVADEPELLAARQRALDLAGAFSNDGYRLRDGTWSIFLTPGQPRLLRVFLFAGNEYWFSAATAMPGPPPNLEIFSASGEPLEAQKYAGEGNAALGFLPLKNGIYLLRASLPGEKTAGPVPFCLVYSYK